MPEVITLLINFIIKVVFDLLIFTVIFYFLLELMGPRYHYPLKELILRYTQPLLGPLHRFIPNHRNVNVGLLLILFILETFKLFLLFLVAWQFPDISLFFIWTILLLFNAFLNFYFFAVFFRLLISWIMPIYSNYPVAQVLFMLTEPLLKPFRQRVTIKRFDWTPLVAIVVIKIISMLISYTLMSLGAPRIIS